MVKGGLFCMWFLKQLHKLVFRRDSSIFSQTCPIWSLCVGVPTLPWRGKRWIPCWVVYQTGGWLPWGARGGLLPFLLCSHAFFSGPASPRMTLSQQTRVWDGHHPGLSSQGLPPESSQHIIIKPQILISCGFVMSQFQKMFLFWGNSCAWGNGKTLRGSGRACSVQSARDEQLLSLLFVFCNIDSVTPQA